MSRARGRQWNGIKGGGRENPYAATHWTRQEAADYLGVRKNTIIAWEKAKVLPFLVDKWGQRWFVPDDVRRVPVSHAKARRGFPESKEGKLHAVVFQMFKDNVPFVDIVTKLQISVQKVRALYTQYSYELDDVLPAKPHEVAMVKAAKLAIVKTEKELEAERLAAHRREHERRMRQIQREEGEKERFAKKKEKLGTSNLKPEEPDHE